MKEASVGQRRVGTLLVAQCPCGYESPELVEGTGELAPPAKTPAPCFSCRRVISVLAERDAPCCPRCKQRVHAYYAPPRTASTPEECDEEAQDLEGPLLTDPWECPRCRKHTLLFRLVALWD